MRIFICRNWAKRAIVLAASVALGCCVNVSADIGQTYDSVVSGYADKSEMYKSQVEYNGGTASVVYLDGIDAVVNTETNVRTGPSKETERITTIGTDAQVKVWGITDNEWCRVWCVSDGQSYFGYIKADLLYSPQSVNS